MVATGGARHEHEEDSSEESSDVGKEGDTAPHLVDGTKRTKTAEDLDAEPDEDEHPGGQLEQKEDGHERDDAGVWVHQHVGAQHAADFSGKQHRARN